jgi:hypothetical protein
VILGVEVLYERRQLEPLACFIAGHLTPHGTAIICDSYRQVANEFPAVAAAAGLTSCERRIETPGGSEPQPGRVFELRRAAGSSAGAVTRAAGHAPAASPPRVW